MRKPWSRRIADVFSLILFLSLLSGCAAPGGKPPGVNWETYSFDARRANATADAVEFPLEKAWQRSLSPFEPLRLYPEEQKSSPALHEGVMFIGSADRGFYAFNLFTGKVLWKINAGEPIESSPTVSGEKVFFGTSGGALKCLDIKDGKEAWGLETRSEINSSPLVSGGRVFIYSSDDRVHAVDAESGEKIWSYGRPGFRAVQPRLFSSPASSPDGETVYQLFSDGRLLALKADSGRVLWERKVAEDAASLSGVRHTPLVFRDSVFVIDGTGKVIELYGGSGELRRAFDFMEAASDFVVLDGTTIVAAGGSRVASFDMLKNAVVWDREIKGVVKRLFASSGHVFAVTGYKKVPFGIEYLEREKGYITALSRKDGSNAWEMNLDSTVTAGAATSGGKVAIFADNGRVTVLGKKK